VEPHDTVLAGGLVFDGRGRPAEIRDVGIRDGRVATISRVPLAGLKRIDCTGKWVVPGFIDCHTHYDAEVEVGPGLVESVRHGVTTVLLGSCSLSLAIGEPDDLADLFCRVEAIPEEHVRPLLHARKTWDGHRDYFDHLDSLALGPNISSFVGHSAVRAHVMGIARSLKHSIVPERIELAAMEHILEEALDAGWLGLSVQTLPWDKVGGDRDIRSRPLPSTYARWSEYRRLTRILRERDRILQAVPSPTRPLSSLLFFVESTGIVRKRLKTTLISMMDLRANRFVRHLTAGMARIFNAFFDADFRWQALPEVFDLWADGLDLVVFEEFGAGAAALHFGDHAQRVELLRDPEYRVRFRRDWTNKYLPKFFHRDLSESLVLACPDASLVGKSFTEIAKDLGHDAIDTFLDLVAEHGTRLRWYTVMANDRPEVIREMVSSPDVLIGFSDAGAHLRQMAHYNFPLRMLRLARDSKFMSIERAVHRVTGEIAAWLGIDAGTIAVGKRADVVVVDPEALDDDLDRAFEAPMECFAGFSRMVRRNDRAVKLVLIGGETAFADGKPSPALGQKKLGRVLKA
jgi:N-acyl-D-aspartate/D-glutamate deacylase